MRRTAKGEMLDLDLIKAKQQMVEKPVPEEVSVRQAIIDRRLRKKTIAMNPSVLNTKPTPVKKEVVVQEENVEVVNDVENSTDTSTTEDKPVQKRRQKTKPTQSTGDAKDVTD